MPTIRKAKRSSGSDLSVVRSELSTLPARLLTKLPVETRIFVQTTGTKSEFVLTTALDAPAAKRGAERRQPCWFAASEVDALVLGVEMDRLFASDLTAFALGKMRDRGFRVTEEHALAGARNPQAWGDDSDEHDSRRALSVGELLDALDLEITRIELGPLAPSISEPESVPARAA